MVVWYFWGNEFQIFVVRGSILFLNMLVQYIDVLLEKMQNNTNSASIWFQYEEEIQILKQELSEVEI